MIINQTTEQATGLQLVFYPNSFDSYFSAKCGCLNKICDTDGLATSFWDYSNDNRYVGMCITNISLVEKLLVILLHISFPILLYMYQCITAKNEFHRGSFLTPSYELFYSFLSSNNIQHNARAMHREGGAGAFVFIIVVKLNRRLAILLSRAELDLLMD